MENLGIEVILAKYGITLFDENGKMKTLYQVIEEVSDIWNSLTIRQQNEIKEILQ